MHLLLGRQTAAEWILRNTVRRLFTIPCNIAPRMSVILPSVTCRLKGTSHKTAAFEKGFCSVELFVEVYLDSYLRYITWTDSWKRIGYNWDRVIHTSPNVLKWVDDDLQRTCYIAPYNAGHSASFEPWNRNARLLLFQPRGWKRPNVMSCLLMLGQSAFDGGNLGGAKSRNHIF